MNTLISRKSAIAKVTAQLNNVKGNNYSNTQNEVIFIQESKCGTRNNAIALTKKVQAILGEYVSTDYAYSTVIAKEDTSTGVRQLVSIVRLTEKAKVEKATKYQYAADMTPAQKKAFRKAQRKLAKKAQAQVQS